MRHMHKLQQILFSVVVLLYCPGPCWCNLNQNTYDVFLCFFFFVFIFPWTPNPRIIYDYGHHPIPFKNENIRGWMYESDAPLINLLTRHANFPLSFFPSPFLSIINRVRKKIIYQNGKTEKKGRGNY